MNIYKTINEIIDYIENHLEEEIDYNKLAKIMGVNVYTMKKIFALLTNISITEYIRNRRLTLAGYELLENNTKVIDLALKYGYNNVTSFSRAFSLFHGVKPSQVKKQKTLKNYPKINMIEQEHKIDPMEYEIIKLDSLKFFGLKIKTNNISIKYQAPKFIKETKNKYGEINYAMVTYEDETRDNCNYYYVLYDKDIKGSEKIKISASKWLKFTIPNKNAKDIQKLIDKFYYEFLPSCKFNLKELPEFEYYHDNITEFLIAIY